jgi:hypothetical protein
MQPLAAEALRLDLFDLSVIRVLTRISVSREEVEDTAAFLKALGHVPFDRPPMSWTVLPAPVPMEGRPIAGSIDRVSWVGSDGIRVAGWAEKTGDPVEELLVADPSGRLLARMVTGLPGAAARERRPRRSGWAG